MLPVASVMCCGPALLLHQCVAVLSLLVTSLLLFALTVFVFDGEAMPGMESNGSDTAAVLTCAFCGKAAAFDHIDEEKAGGRDVATCHDGAPVTGGGR